jgi:hypothetical protein
MRRPQQRLPPIKDASGKWARSNDEIVDVFAQHLAKTFTPHDASPGSTPDPVPDYQSTSQLKMVIPKETATLVDQLKLKKAPGPDKVPALLLKQLPKKGIVFLTYLFNAVIRLKYFPLYWKRAKIILIPKPGKPAELTSSYRPISLLPIIAKMMEKILLSRIESFLNEKNAVPDHQFGFQRKHAAVDQVHRVVQVIKNALEEKKFCEMVFLDVSQAFDRVHHAGLMLKLSHLLPGNLCAILES